MKVKPHRAVLTQLPSIDRQRRPSDSLGVGTQSFRTTRSPSVGTKLNVFRLKPHFR